MVIDSHQHLWKYDPATCGWITPEMSWIRRDFLSFDLLRELEDNQVDGSVAVQSIASESDTSFLVTEADRNDFIRGVVGWLDLCNPLLELRLRYYSGCSKFKGLRHLVQSEPDDQFLLREDFCRGIGMLGPHHLTYDLLILPRHLPAAARLARKFPDQKFVIDHLAKPLIREGRLSPWKDQIRETAALPNVYCKLSGMVTEADPSGWKPEDFHPFMDVVLEAFGPRRTMFGSDWPVCLVCAGYEQVIGMVRQYIRKLSGSEQEAIMGNTASEFYGL
ncbi:MAG TPA: amidohydrolase family protein [Chitinophagaceae bacterium]|nr:amidohydrolase family protein [Chitinophagaceae bacterium]